MTPDQRARINRLIDAALDLTEPERSAFIDSACAGDETLRHEIDELLAGGGSAEGFLCDEAAGDGRVEPVFESGQVVGERFRIVRFRGRGGMGEVYEAYDERLRVRLGLKTLRADLTPDPDALDRFQREIRVAHEVTHPNLCRVFDLVEHRQPAGAAGDGGGAVITCLTMEWLEGETLQALLERARPLPIDDALSLARQIASALDALHLAGIIHRDLKPGNIMLVQQPDGSLRAVVTDFGLAKPVSGGREWFESKNDAQAGAPYFMAPEQLRNERPTAGSDLYAFGLVLDEMVTASRAFNAGSLGALYYQRLWEQPIPPSARAHGLPPAWDRAIRSCLDADPAGRPATAGEVIHALATQELLPEPQPFWETKPAPAPPPPPEPKPQRRWMFGSALALVPLIAGLVAVSGALSTVETSVKVFDIDTSGLGQELEYLSRGTTAELLRRLTHLEGVRVIPARTTRRLAADSEGGGSHFLLDGSLMLHDGGARLSMSLADTRDGSLVWSEVFAGRVLDDPVAFQTRIAQGAAVALEQRVLAKNFAGGKLPLLASLAAPVQSLLGRGLIAQVPHAPTADPQALNLYMRGSKLYEEVSPASAQAALSHYERALALDPKFALAMSASADAYIYLKNHDAGNAPAYLARAREFADSAVKADPLLAEGHAALAAVRQASWDWEGAGKGYREALRLRPGFARAHRWYCGLIMQFGRFDEALAHGRKAMELDPYDRATPATYGLYLFLAGRYREALAVIEPAVQEVESLGTRYNLAQVYARLGSLTQGVESHEYFGKALEQIRLIESTEKRASQPASAASLPSLADQLYALVHSLAGDRAAAEPYFARLREEFRQRRIPALTVAWVYAAQGRLEEALSVLEQAVAYRDPALLYIKVVPFLENLRGQPRFEALLTQMRL